MPSISAAARAAFSLAAHEAKNLGSANVEPEHLFLGLCKVEAFAEGPPQRLPGVEAAEVESMRAEIGEWTAMLGAAGFDAAAARRRLRGLCRAPSGVEQPFSGHRSRRARDVFAEAEALGAGAVTLLTLGRALLALSSPTLDSYLDEQGDLRARLRRAFESPRPTPPSAPPLPVHAAEDDRPAGPMPRLPQMLTAFGRSLTSLAMAGKLAPVIGRDEETKQVARILLQAKKSNPMLVGDPGVGKTAIAEGLAMRLLDPQLPEGLRRLHLFDLSLGQLVAGTSHRGEFEDRVQAIIRIAEADPSLVLFIDEIHMLLGAGGGSGAMDAANLLKPALARRAIRVIGATTTAEYRQHIEKDAALERRFQRVWVEEPTRDQAVAILDGLRPGLEKHHGATIAPEAIAKAVDLSIRYMPDQRLPDKAIDIVDQACSRAALPTVMFRHVSSGEQPALRSVDVDDVAAVVAERARIPVERLTISETERLLQMEEDLARRVIGQDHAIVAVADAIRTARAGLKRPQRPVGVFLFLGPTGTGKTELAKALAQFLFDDEKHLIRIDMSEYGNESSIMRLIGAPPGYIGHDEGSQLADPVRTNPYSVVLFDEIEKAHPKVFDIFLQIFDDGRLTDSHGRRAAFGETVIILTSNLGSGQTAAPEASPIGFIPPPEPPVRRSPRATVVDPAWAAYERAHRDAAAAALRPELLNRIQRIVCFRPLSPATVRQIIDKILDGVSANLGERQLTLSLAPDAYSLLMQHGYDPAMGARQMERTIDRLIVQPLARSILEGRYPPGAVVSVGVREGTLVLG